MKNDELVQSIFDADSNSAIYEQKVICDKLKDELAKFGLTPNQSKVYIYLGKYGSKTAPEVCKALKMPRTETYHLLTTLQNKGLVSATFQHPTRFSAESLNKAIWVLVNAEKERVNTLESQESEIKKLWDSIPEFISVQETKEEKFQMLEGPNQINSKIKEMIKTANGEFLVLGAEKDFLKFYHANHLEDFKQSKINFKLLSSISENAIYIFDDIDSSKIKKIPTGVHDNLCFLIKDRKEILHFIKNANQTTQQMNAMWTDSETLVYSMKTLFDSFWAISKNMHL
ncbi:MAG: TrmB family transcriptional regulator [Thaumarchaeota archaeon]|nr:TrmB family transcriptional regulator [Nitrososphaerota archaeon]